MASSSTPPPPTRFPSLFHLPPSYFDSALLLFDHHHPVASLPPSHPPPESRSSEESRGEHAHLALESQPPDSKEPMHQWACRSCGLHFLSLDEQRAHFKSDFHRWNVKRKLVGKKPVSEEEFEVLAEGQWPQDDDISSISGSDEEGSDSGDEGSKSQRISIMGQHHNLENDKHISLLLKSTGDIVIIWRCALLGDREVLIRGNEGWKERDREMALYLTEEDVLGRLRALTAGRTDHKNIWVILLATGGHFAGCVFDTRGGSIVAHKTHHRYVVRAKAGGRQSTKDAAGRAPKSAGASLRRYNEMALKKEIRDVLFAWKNHLKAASAIFLHAPSGNSQVLFGGEDSPLDRSDSRIRKIPLTTRRPTLKEAKRVFHHLTSLTYKEDDNLSFSSKASSMEAGAVMASPGKVGIELGENDFSQSDGAKDNLVHFSSASDAGPAKENEDPFPGSGPLKDTEELSTESRSTPLHDAARSGNATLVLELLEGGADPCAREERGRTPYVLATDKDTRNAFRRFMAGHLEMWDWHAANVPSPLTEEMEAAQIAKQAEKDAKRKAKAKEQKKMRKAKEKAQAQASSSEKLVAAASMLVCHGMTAVSQNPIRPLNTESILFKEALNSVQALEREKRAAAAERRLLVTSSPVTAGTEVSGSSSQSSSTNAISNCCSCCGASLAGKTPFFRYTYKYCSTTCVHVHRKAIEG